MIHHRVKIKDESMWLQLGSVIVISAIVLPDNVIDLMDEAGSRVRLRGLVAPPELKELEAKISEISVEKEAAIRTNSLNRRQPMDQEQKLQEELEAKRSDWRKSHGRAEAVVTAEDIAAVVAGWTGIPVTDITEEDASVF